MPIKKIILVMTLAAVNLFASWALADEMGPQGDKFYEEAAHFENACREGACKPPYSSQILLIQEKNFDKLAPEVKTNLRAIATKQASLWDDTILEGDYVAAGNTRLDHVVAYYKNANLIGYKISYSEKAWFTANCGFDGRNRETLKDCEQGRISEGSYVSADMQTFFSDEDRYAEFLALATH